MNNNSARSLVRYACAASLLLFLIFIPVSGPGKADAEVVGHFGVTQLLDLGDEIQVFFELQGPTFENIYDLELSELSASLGSVHLPVLKMLPFKQANEGISTVLLVDISKSLSPARFSRLREALMNWVDSMAPVDRSALVVFGKETRILSDFTDDREHLKNIIAELGPSDMETELFNGIIQAISLASQRNALIPGRRIILLLSDGVNDAPGSATQEEALASISSSGLPVFALGYVPTGGSAGEMEKSLGVMGMLARSSGGELYREDKGNFSEIYASIHKRLLDSQVLWLDSSNISRDGKFQRFSLVFSRDEKSFNAGKDIRLIPLAERTLTSGPDPDTVLEGPAIASPDGVGFVDASSEEEGKSFGVFAAIAILTAVFGGFILHFAKKKRKKDEVKTPDLFVNVGSIETDKLQSHNSISEPGELEFRAVGKKAMPFKIRIIDKVTVGRNEDCELVIRDDSSVSAFHCEISFGEGVFQIKDLGSTNGTRLNGTLLKPGSPARIDKGDVVTIGRTQIQLVNIS